jgi:hypothetical protein
MRGTHAVYVRAADSGSHFSPATSHSSQRPSVGLTDRDGLAVDETHLVIKEGVYDGEYKVYETDRYGMPEDIPSKVIKTDRLGRQEVYRTDRYGMPSGDPIDEKNLE